MNIPIDAMISKIRTADRRSIGKAMSLIENNSEKAPELMNRLHTYTGNAYRIGITGPPGAGKSTLTSGLIRELRNQGEKIGVVAVDPTSPFTGGAVLGDRIRMMGFSADPEVFIRSMASRGSLGGLSRRAQEIADVLDASGKNYVIYETVGVGQTELDIADNADTVVVVLVPESGDAIQTMKAGLMEIADIFVVNKSDREGASTLKMELESMLQFRPISDSKWEIPILSTVGIKSEGVDELIEKIQEHKKFLEDNNLLFEKRTKRMNRKINEILQDHLLSVFWTSEKRVLFEKKLPQIINHKLSPYELVKLLLNLVEE
jgi:LAO/AO transport system kinase